MQIKHSSHKNKYIKRFHTSFQQNQEHNDNLKDHSNRSYTHQIGTTQLDCMIRYRQHIQFLQKKLIYQQQITEQYENQLSIATAQCDKLKKKVKNINIDKESIQKKLQNAILKIEELNDDVELQKLKTSIINIEKRKQSEDQGSSSSQFHRYSRSSFKKTVENPQNFHKFIQKESKVTNKKQKICRKLQLIKCIDIDFNMYVKSKNKSENANKQTETDEMMVVNEDKLEIMKIQYEQKIRNYEQAIAYLNNKLKNTQKSIIQSKKLMSQKQQIIHNFSKENRQLLSNYQQLQLKNDQLHQQMLQIEHKYADNLQQSEHMTDKIKQGLLQVIDGLKSQLIQKQQEILQTNNDCERWKQYSIQKQARLIQQQAKLRQEQYKLRQVTQKHQNQTKQQMLIEEQISKYKDQIQNLRNEYNRLKQQLEQFRKQKQISHKQLQLQINRMREQNKKQIQKNGQISRQLNERGQFIKKLKKNHEDALKSASINMKQTLQNINKQNRHLIQQLSVKANILKSLQAQILNNNQVIQQQKTTIETMTQQMQLVKQIFQRQKINEFSQTQNNTSIQLQDLQAHVSELMKQKNQNIQFFQDQNDNLRQQIIALQKQIEEVGNEGQRNNLYLEAAKAKIEEMQECIERSEVEIKEKMQQINELKHNIETHQEKQIQYQEFIQKMRASGVSTYEG